MSLNGKLFSGTLVVRSAAKCVTVLGLAFSFLGVIGCSEHLNAQDAALTKRQEARGDYRSVAKSNVSDNIESIDYGQLPIQAQRVIRNIKLHQAFPYRQDGQVFANREGILPKQERGYYREYTVVTPGVESRGARRMIVGLGRTQELANHDEYYYTADHYRSFRRVQGIPNMQNQ